MALVVGGTVVATSLAPGAGRDVDALVRATMTAPGLKPEVLSMGERQYVAGAFPLKPDIPGGDAGRLLVLSDWAQTQKFIDTLRDRFFLAGIVALILSLLGGVFLSRHLNRPLRDIATAAAQISAGNLSLQVPIRGTAEAATVARAFNAMSVSLRNAHERLVHDAIHDDLTKLPNRALFKERLDRALARRARRRDYQFAVLFVDLDRFKHVNDSLGHTAGDRLLVTFAERLAAAVRRDDVVMRVATGVAAPEPTLARLGGDEFAVLLDDIREPIDAVRVAERVQQMATLPLPLDGQEVFTSASIGVAVASDSHRSGEDVIRDADLAMYRAKNAGGGSYSVFDAALHDAAVHRLRLETDLRRAVERGEFRVWYQPIVALANHQVVGVEALVRWEHPERGMLGPGAFLDVAEEVGLITQLDEWVLQEACLQGREWLASGTFGASSTISVNLSAKAFAKETLVQTIRDTLNSTGYAASGLRLEVTESVAIKDAKRARAVLAELRALGVRISLDDFGTGYSSLSYLQSLPLDTLKIDRSFVAGIDIDEDKGEIIKLIVGLARTLGLEIVAEGTETAAQVEYLCALGCQFGQGYYFAKPAPASPAGRPAERGPRRRPRRRLAAVLAEAIPPARNSGGAVLTKRTTPMLLLSSLRRTLTADPRHGQILTLASLLTYGLGWLGFDLGLTQVARHAGHRARRAAGRGLVDRRPVARRREERAHLGPEPLPAAAHRCVVAGRGGRRDRRRVEVPDPRPRQARLQPDQRRAGGAAADHRPGLGVAGPVGHGGGLRLRDGLRRDAGGQPRGAQRRHAGLHRRATRRCSSAGRSGSANRSRSRCTGWRAGGSCSSASS